MKRVIDTIRPALDSVAPAAIAAALTLTGSVAPAAALGAAAMGLGAVGCAAPTAAHDVRASGEAIDRTTQALMVGDLKALAGTYGDQCVDRSGAWHLALSDEKVDDALSVVEGNAECQLTLTHVVAGKAYALEKPMVLATSFASPTRVGDGAEAFYVNAKLDSSKMSSDFAITLLFSDVASAVDTSFGMTYATISAGTSTSVVAAPSYTVDFEKGALSVKVNTKKTVTAVSGSAVLVEGAEKGSGYVVDPGKLGDAPTFEQVDEVYKASKSEAITGSPQAVPADSFGLVGADVSKGALRTIIVRGGTDDMPAYQLIRVAFKTPS